MKYFSATRVKYVCVSGIKVMEERKHCLMLGEEASLDMNAITQHVVENVRRRDTTDANMETEMQLEANISPVTN